MMGRRERRVRREIVNAGEAAGVLLCLEVGGNSHPLRIASRFLSNRLARTCVSANLELQVILSVSRKKNKLVQSYPVVTNLL